MKTLVYILMLTAIPLLHAEEASREKWETKLSLLTNGMTRTEVERILPQGSGMRGVFSSGSGYTIIYNLDTEASLHTSTARTRRCR